MLLEYFTMRISPGLEQRWNSLMNRHSPESVIVKTAAIERIARQMSEQGRHYHTLMHVENVLKYCDDLRSGEVSAAIDFAAFLHDVVYDSKAKDNEDQSADTSDELLGELKVPGEIIAETRRLILLTKKHETEPEDADGAVFLDADLSILAEPLPVYKDYALNVRREYGWVPDESYIVGRGDFMRKFLQRPQLFFTNLMRRFPERQARENISWEIDHLPEIAEEATR